MEASIEIAGVIFAKSTTDDSYKARCLREWGATYLKFGTLPQFRQGKHSKGDSIITDDYVKRILIEQLRLLDDNSRTPSTFAKILNSELLLAVKKETAMEVPVCISVETARRWMHILKFKPDSSKKGYYTDGHNRVDVVKDRETRFLPQMLDFEKRMREYSGDNMEIIKEPVLNEGKVLYAGYVIKIYSLLPI